MPLYEKFVNIYVSAHTVNIAVYGKCHVDYLARKYFKVNIVRFWEDVPKQDFIFFGQNLGLGASGSVAKKVQKNLFLSQ